MSVAIYFILTIVGASLLVFNSTYCLNVILIAMLIPILDFIGFIIKERTIKLINLPRSISFILIGIINYYSFSFQVLPFRYYIYGIVLLLFVTSVYLKWKSYSKFITRWLIYLVLIGLAFFNSSLSNLQRLNLYTLEDPIYSNKITVKRLTEFAYIYYQGNDKTTAIFLLNRALEDVDQEIYGNEVNQKERELLVKEHNQIKNNLILLLQNKWVIKGRYIE